MLLILAAQRRLLPLALAAADGDWDVYEWPLLGQLHRLRSRTVGIIGLGRIGHLVAQKLHGFRPTVIAYDPFIERHPRPRGRAGLARRAGGAVRHRRLVRGPDRHVARDHRCRLPVQDQARRADRQRVARRDRRRGRAGGRPGPRSRRLRGARRPVAGAAGSVRRTGSPAATTSSSPSTSPRARSSRSRDSTSRQPSRSSSCSAKPAGCRPSDAHVRQRIGRRRDDRRGRRRRRVPLPRRLRPGDHRRQRDPPDGRPDLRRRADRRLLPDRPLRGHPGEGPDRRLLHGLPPLHDRGHRAAGHRRPDHGQHVHPVADLDRRPRVHRPGRDDPERPHPRAGTTRRRRRAARPSRTT